jgi:nicotinamide-nucleotide amidase
MEGFMDNIILSNEEKVISHLKARGYHISFAESCTGGLASAKLISVPDASSVINESYVTYANESKIKLLGVKPESISSEGVVSELVAGEMAKGVAQASGSEVGVGITGIAGPSIGSDLKPVGMVSFGFYINGMLTTKTVNFGDIGRNEVRESAASHVFKILDYLFENEQNA